MKAKKLTRMALLTAVALGIFVLEAQLPPLLPVPGVKLGLANIVTVYAVFALGPWEATAILAVRMLLGAACTGQVMGLLYAAAGGTLALAVTAVLRRALKRKQIWVAGCLGAVAHNLGQLAVAVAVTRTPALIGYLPVLVAAGLAAGLFTGLAAQALLARLDRVRPGAGA